MKGFGLPIILLILQLFIRTGKKSKQCSGDFKDFVINYKRNELRFILAKPKMSDKLNLI